jgi:hypothetical protein
VTAVEMVAAEIVNELRFSLYRAGKGL